jgi:hypothetical protein
VGDPGGHLAQGPELLGADQVVLGGGQLTVGARALLVQGLGLLEPTLTLPGELGVLERQPYLRGHPLDQPDLGRRELPPRRPPDQEERTDALAPDGGRCEQNRERGQVPDPLRIEAFVVVGISAQD